MGDVGLESQMILELVSTLVYWFGWFLTAMALLGFSVYVIFLCVEIGNGRPRLKARIAKAPQSDHPLLTAEQGRSSRSAIRRSTLAVAECLGEEARPMPTRPHKSQNHDNLAPVTLPLERPPEFER